MEPEERRSPLDVDEIEILDEKSTSTSSLGGIETFKKIFSLKKVLRFILNQIWSIRGFSIFLSVTLILITVSSIFGVGVYHSNLNVSEQTKLTLSIHINNLKKYVRNVFEPFPKMPLSIASNYQNIVRTLNSTSKARDFIPGVLFTEAKLYDKKMTYFIGLERDGGFWGLGDQAEMMFCNYNNSFSSIPINKSTGEVYWDRSIKYVPFPTNARNRPWYMKGKEVYEGYSIYHIIEKNHVAYSDVFPAWGKTASLLLAVSTPILNPNTNEFIGVAAASLGITGDRAFSSMITQDLGTFLIIEKNGYIIGSSFGNDIEYYNKTSKKLIFLHNHDVVLYRNIGVALLHRFGSYSNITEFSKDELLYIVSEGESNILNVGIWEDYDHDDIEVGLKLIIITVVKEYEINRYAIQNFYMSALVSGICLVVAVIFAICFACSISVPIHQIKNSLAKLIKLNFNFEYKGNVLQLYELSKIGEAFEELKLVFSNFQYFIPRKLIKDIFKNEQIKRKLKIKFLTISFVDIKGFTGISETLKEVELVQVLTLFFEICEEHIINGNGIVDKYIGDAVMSIFGLNSSVTIGPNNANVGLNHAHDAVEAFFKIKNDFSDEINTFNSIEGYRHIKNLQIQCGINTGSVLVGCIGTSTRYSYTCIGDSVNISSRLEGLNKKYGTQILVGQQTRDCIVSSHNCVSVGKVVLRGKSESQNVYKVTHKLKPKTKTRVV